MNIDFNTGDLILYHGMNNYFSKMIEYETNSKYSHVAMVLKDPTFISDKLKGLYIIESGEENIPDSEDNKKKIGVQIIPLDYILNNWEGDIYYRKLNCIRDDKFYKNLIEAHNDVHNLPYDLDPIDWFKAKFQLYIGNTQKSNKFWCSALVSYIYVKLGLLNNSIPWTLITPVEFGTEKNQKNLLKFINCSINKEIKIN